MMARCCVILRNVRMIWIRRGVCWPWRLFMTAAGDVTPQVVRDWVLRLNAEGPAGLSDSKAPGQAAKLDAAQRQALTERVERGPIPSVDGGVRWRLVDRAGWIRSGYGFTVPSTTMSLMLRAMGYVELSARLRYEGQNEHALEAFRKNLCRHAGDAPSRYAGRDLVTG